MNRRPLFLLLVSLTLVACVDQPEVVITNNGGGGSDTSASSGSSSAASTGSGTPNDQIVTITMDTFDIAPGAEVYKCQNFGNTKFVSTVAGEPFFHTEEWAEPTPLLFDPPKQLKAGDPLKFTCTYVNTSPETLTFGESAASNEMCILVASYFPAPDGQPTIDCN